MAKNGSRRRLVFAVALLLGVSGIVWAWWRSRSQPANGYVSAVKDDEFDELMVVKNPGYVGPQVCAECHGARCAEFQNTRHFRACWPSEAGSMPPGFTKDKASYDARTPGVRFEMTQSGQDFLLTLVRGAQADKVGQAAGPSGPQKAKGPDQGETRHTARIDLVYGSAGKADEVFFTWKGDRLYELPMVWLHPMERWAEQPYDPNYPGDLTRVTTPRCVECHNTWLEHVPGTENEYRREHAIFGVSCENCHGPGRAHVRFHRDNPKARTAHAIVHPGQLSRERQLDLCGQCHSNAMRARGPAFSYRPGEPLEAHFRTNLATGIENDHVADQVKYLRQSKCFQKSDTLTCTTCHNPHRPTDPQSSKLACFKCHEQKDCKEQPRLPAALREECIACHMPRYHRVAVMFHTPQDKYVFPVRPHEHRVGVYPAARDEVLYAWHRGQADAENQEKAEQLRKSLTEHWLTEADKLKGAHRFHAALGAVREALRLDPSPAIKAKLQETAAIQAKVDAGLVEALLQANERRFPDAIKSLEGVLQQKPNSAKARGKLGTYFAALGQNDRALEQLQEVVKSDPDDAYGLNMLGWLAYLGGDGAGAAQAFRRADEIQPYSAEINYRWGLSLLLLGSWKEAETHFRQVVRIDPKHAGGFQGASHALQRQNRSEEALRFAVRAAQLTQHENADILVTLSDAYAAVGRGANAIEAAKQALANGKSGGGRLSPQVRERLEKRVAGVDIQE
ncbi:MAG: tetratricopeptide repeat protein [Gemmataceae bacterium]|nr:tetratricopeptide repeat protein [Gemmataceae bacterium]